MPKAREAIKFEELVVNAIKLLQAAEGSTASEIAEYMDLKGAPELKNQLRSVIKQGVDAGLIQKSKRGYTTWGCSSVKSESALTDAAKKQDADKGDPNSGGNNNNNNNTNRRRLTRSSFFDWYQQVIGSKKDLKRGKRGSRKKSSGGTKSSRSSRPKRTTSRTTKRSMVTRSQAKKGKKSSKRKSKSKV